MEQFLSLSVAPKIGASLTERNEFAPSESNPYFGCSGSKFFPLKVAPGKVFNAAVLVDLYMRRRWQLRILSNGALVIAGYIPGGHATLKHRKRNAIDVDATLYKWHVSSVMVGFLHSACGKSVQVWIKLNNLLTPSRPKFNLYPSGHTTLKWRRINVDATWYVASTLIRRHFDVMCLLGCDPIINILCPKNLCASDFTAACWKLSVSLLLYIFLFQWCRCVLLLRVVLLCCFYNFCLDNRQKPIKITAGMWKVSWNITT